MDPGDLEGRVVLGDPVQEEVDPEEQDQVVEDPEQDQVVVDQVEQEWGQEDQEVEDPGKIPGRFLLI